MSDERSEVTILLENYTHGESGAYEKLLPLVYSELRRIAGAYMARERAEHTLQPTALVHEAFLKLVDQRSVKWKNRSHFFGVAAQLMRRILVDHARQKQAAKRGGAQARICFDEGIHWEKADQPTEILELDNALLNLSKHDERQAQVVELRYFGGLTIEEVATVLDTSPATVKRDWTMAKAWLKREIQKGHA